MLRKDGCSKPPRRSDLGCRMATERGGRLSRCLPDCTCQTYRAGRKDRLPHVPPSTSHLDGPHTRCDRIWNPRDGFKTKQVLTGASRCNATIVSLISNQPCFASSNAPCAKTTELKEFGVGRKTSRGARASTNVVGEFIYFSYTHSHLFFLPYLILLSVHRPLSPTALVLHLAL